MTTSELLRVDRAHFASHFGREAFGLEHDLADHPLFRMERMLELARALPARRVEYNPGDLPVSHHPECTPHNGLSVERTLQRIESCGSWMVLKRIESDPEYRALMDRCLDELAPLVGEHFQRIGFLFVSSPGATTPYHIDPENNFLLQIRGTKEISVFPRHDRQLASERELERFFGGGHRNVPFDSALAERGRSFPLGPGLGVHVPLHSPHFVRNGPEVSVSFSITFQTPESDRSRGVYWTNDKLRRLGLEPTKPGRSARGDAVKYGVFRGLRAVRRTFRR